MSKKPEFHEKPMRIQTFTNLQSINTVSSLTTERKNSETPDRKLDPQIQNQKIYYREVVPPRPHHTSSIILPPILETTLPFPKPIITQKIVEEKHVIEEQKTEEDKEFQNINLKKFKIEDFELGMKLGKGKFGNVYLAREKATNYIVALKILNKIEVQRLNGEKLIVREIKIHSFVDHPNIIKLYGFFHDDQNIYLILEYAPGGEVYEELKKSVLLLAKWSFF